MLRKDGKLVFNVFGVNTVEHQHCVFLRDEWWQLGCLKTVFTIKYLPFSRLGEMLSPDPTSNPNASCKLWK